jgi:Xaa-Pro aminopeptidase
MGQGVAVLVGAPHVNRNGDVHYDYRQGSDFYYLTGFEEPEAVAIIAPDHPKHRFVLFVRPRDPAMEIWNGPRAGVEGARRRFGADAAYPAARLDEILPQYLSGPERLFYKVGRDKAFDDRIIGMLNTLRAQARAGLSAPSTLADPAEILAEMRLFKGPEEIGLLRKAIALTDQGHRAAMAVTRPGMMEFQVQAEMEGVFRAGGSPRLGYGSIVGSGANATVLHYTQNTRRMKAGELLLIDAGTECGYYTADVTRTFPVDGRFSPAQRAVYEVVLDAQKEAIRKVRPGVSFQAVHDAAVEVLTEGCRKLGLLKGPARRLIKTGAFRAYYMHRTSHWLGMDVHDAGKYREGKGWRKLKPGMVLTVEPGLYIAPDCRKAPTKYRGIGVRIEDDILVTKQGHENLTEALPRDPEAVEALVGRG